MSRDFYAAMALVFVLEGIMPFLKPEIWRRTMGRMVEQSNDTLRWMGLFSMLVGLGLLYWVGA